MKPPIDGKKYLLLITGIIFLILVAVSTAYFVFRQSDQGSMFTVYDVRLTNLTSSSATITWRTDSPSKGLVRYGTTEDDRTRFTAYDDRDHASALIKLGPLVEADILDDGIVSIDESSIQVDEVGKYYTHHVTIQDLQPDTMYYFELGDGEDFIDNISITPSFSFPVLSSSFTTFQVQEELLEPNPAYGKILSVDGVNVDDAVAFLRLYDLSDQKPLSHPISAVLNEEGNWYFDLSSLRDGTGKQISDVSLDTYGEMIYVDAGILGVSEVALLRSSFDSPASDLYVSPFNVGLEIIDTQLNSSIMQKEQSIFLQTVYAYDCNLLSGGSNCTTVNTDGGTGCRCDNGDWIGHGTCEEAYKECDRKSQQQNTSNSSTTNPDSDTSPSASNSNSTGTPGTSSGKKGPGSFCGDLHPGDGGNYWGTCKEGLVCVPCAKDTVSGYQFDRSACMYPGDDATLRCGGSISNMRSCARVDSNPASQHCSNKNYGKDQASGDECTRFNYCGWPVDYNGKCVCTLNNSDEWNVSCEVMKNKCSTGSGKTSDINADLLKTCESMEQVADVQAKCSNVSKTVIDGNRNVCTEGCHDVGFACSKKPFSSCCGDGVCIAGGSEMWDCPKDCPNARGEVTGSPFWTPPQEKFSSSDNPTASGSSSPASEMYREEQSGAFDIDVIPGEQVAGANSIIVSSEEGLFAFENEGKYCTEYKSEQYCFVIDVPGQTILYIDLNDNHSYDADVDETVSNSVRELEVTEADDSTIAWEIRPGNNYLSLSVVNEEYGPFASDLLEYLNNKYDNVFYSVSTYIDGRWKIVGSREGELINATDFIIAPGRGFVLKSSESLRVELKGQRIVTAVPVSFQAGWNLVAVHGGTNKYTAKSLIDDLNSSTQLSANNVSKWSQYKARYEGLQIDQEAVYGLDYPISSFYSYFIRTDTADTWER